MSTIVKGIIGGIARGKCTLKLARTVQTCMDGLLGGEGVRGADVWPKEVPIMRIGCILRQGEFVGPVFSTTGITACVVQKFRVPSTYMRHMTMVSVMVRGPLLSIGAKGAASVVRGGNAWVERGFGAAVGHV